MTNICGLGMGRKGVIKSVTADKVIRQRLLDMGLLPNCEVIKERDALGGDPIWVKVGDIQLALRRNEAEAITVDEV